MCKSVLVTMILAGVVGLVGPAAAQPAPAPDAPGAPITPRLSVEPPPAATSPAAAHGKRRSAGAALAFSLGGTVATWGLVAASAAWAPDNTVPLTIGLAGTLVAPSLGHWYAGKPMTRGLGIRVLGVAVATLGYYIVAHPEESHQGETRPNLSATPVIVAGALIYLGGTVDDIISAPLRVRKHNRHLDGIGLAPTVTAHSAGLVLGGQF